MFRVALLGLLSLAACSQQPPVPVNEAVDLANHAAPDNVAAPATSWIVGTWSFDTGCATDFLITYQADGALDNRGETGTWKLVGNTVTETLVSKLADGADTPIAVDPPETRTYKAVQTDQMHGMITIQGREVPILRC